MFSSIVSSSQVPARGSWNTRDSRRARSRTDQRVMSWPATVSLPSLDGITPASTFRKVDLPAPLDPITVTNCPAGIDSDTPRRAWFSRTVPGLKTTWMSSASIIAALPSGPGRHGRRDAP